MSVLTPSAEQRRYCRRDHDTWETGRYPKDGKCRVCVYDRTKAWHAANPEKVRESRHQMYLADPEKYKTKARAYVEAHREVALERKRAQSRVYREQNREAIRVRAAAFARKKRAADPEATEAAVRRWRAAHPEQAAAIFRARSAKRRAQLKAVVTEPYDARAVIFDATSCGICHKVYAVGDVRSLDHVVPIARGGADAPWNVQSAHLGCNVKKGARG